MFIFGIIVEAKIEMALVFSRRGYYLFLITVCILPNIIHKILCYYIIFYVIDIYLFYKL